jgi:uncharacterized protein YwgA
MSEDKKRKLEDISKDMAIGVYDAEVEEKVGKMRAELDAQSDAMRTTILLELKKVGRIHLHPHMHITTHTATHSCHQKFA